MTTPPGQQKVNIPIDSLHEVKCVCGSTNFTVLSKLRAANRFQSPNGHPMLMQAPNGFLCVECGKINNFDKETQKVIGPPVGNNETGKPGAE